MFLLACFAVCWPFPKCEEEVKYGITFSQLLLLLLLLLLILARSQCSDLSKSSQKLEDQLLNMLKLAAGKYNNNPAIPICTKAERVKLTFPLHPLPLLRLAAH